MSIRYNMDIVDYNDYAIANINEDNRYDKYDVLRKVMYHWKVMYHYLCNWNKQSICVNLSLLQNNKEMNTVDILIYSLLKNLSDTIGLKEDSYKSIVISNIEIGNILNVSKDTAKRTLNKLVELNLIKIECEGYSNRRIIYMPIEDKWGTKKCQEEDQRRKQQNRLN